MKTLLITMGSSLRSDELRFLGDLFGRAVVIWFPPRKGELPTPTAELRGRLVVTPASGADVKRHLPEAFLENVEFVDIRAARALLAGVAAQRADETRRYPAECCLQLVRDDAAAMAFQNIAQYRAWLIRKMEELIHD